MSHFSDYLNYLSSLSDEERKDVNVDYLPIFVCLVQLWDVWDFVTWPIRRLRAALSHQETGL